MLILFLGERVNTGGLMDIVHPKGAERKMSESERNEIREAYARAEERKARERRNRIVFWIVGLIGLMVASGLIYYFTR